MTQTRRPPVEIGANVGVSMERLTGRAIVLPSSPMVSQIHIATDLMMSMPSPGAGVVSCGWLGVAVR